MSRPFNASRFDREREGFSRFSRERPRSFIQQIREILAQIKEDIIPDSIIDNPLIRIKNPQDAIFLGESTRSILTGKSAKDNKNNFEIKGSIGPVGLQLKYINDTRTLISAQSGSGKSYLARLFIERLFESDILVFIIDPEGEWITLRSKYNFLILGKNKTQGSCDIEIDEENLENTIECCLRQKISIVFNFSEWSDNEDRQKLVTILNEYLLNKVPKELRQSINLVYDEASLLAKKNDETLTNKKCKASLKEIVAQGRKRGISSTFITQRITFLHTDITSGCNVYMLGKVDGLQDLNRNAEFLHLLPKQHYILSSLEYEFIAYGKYFCHYGQIPNDQLVIFKSDKPSSPHFDLIDLDKYDLPPPNKPILKIIEIITAQREGKNLENSLETSQTPTNKNSKSELVGPTLHDHLQFRHSLFSKIVRCFGVIDIKNLFVLLGEEYDEVKSLFEISQWVSMNSDNFKLVDDEIYAENDDSSIDIGSSEEILSKWIDELKNKDLEKIIEYLYNSENENNSLREISQKLKINENTIKEIIEKYKATNLLKFQYSDVYLNTIFFNSRIDKNNDDSDEFDMRSIFDDEDDV